jgi:hypothetical protein
MGFLLWAIRIVDGVLGCVRMAFGSACGGEDNTGKWHSLDAGTAPNEGDMRNGLGNSVEKDFDEGIRAKTSTAL